MYPHRLNPFEGRHTVSLRVENICFSYGEEFNVLDGVSLEIAAGEKVALVGASGGGKSTLVQIILGLYPAKSGELYFDGVNIRDIGLDVVRENVATVLQHPRYVDEDSCTACGECAAVCPGNFPNEFDVGLGDLEVGAVVGEPHAVHAGVAP